MVAVASFLGKRKLSNRLEVQPERQIRANSQRTEDSGSISGEDEDVDGMRDIFRSHFEARFAPLESIVNPREGSSFHAQNEDESLVEPNDGGSNSDWEGLSDGGSDIDMTRIENRNPVQVIEYNEVRLQGQTELKAERKAFMRSEPPSLGEPHLNKTSGRDSKNVDDDEDERTESLNLKNDLELQRLISESHLLDTSNARNLQNQRQKILDVRLQALGAKKSVLDHKNSKMPMAMRKGITSKVNQREAKRRADAKVNGVILERPAHKVQAHKTSASKERKGGFGDPAVGKFRGGATLQLSKKDIAEIRGVGGDASTRRTVGSTRGSKKVKRKR